MYSFLKRTDANGEPYIDLFAATEEAPKDDAGIASLKRARALVAKAEYAQAAAELEKTVELRLDDARRAEAQSLLAFAYLNEGRYEASAAAARLALALDRGYLAAHANLAGALYKLGRYEEARAAFEAAAALAGNKREHDLLKRRATEAANAATPL